MGKSGPLARAQLANQIQELLEKKINTYMHTSSVRAYHRPTERALSVGPVAQLSQVLHWHRGGQRSILLSILNFSVNEFLVSKETVVLRRWESETKFGFCRTS